MSTERMLLIEPVFRADGSLLSMYHENGTDVTVTVSMNSLKGGYPTEVVRKIGQGDFETGLFIVGRALFEATNL